MSMELTSLWAQICRISRSHGWILINRQSVQFVIKTSKLQWKNIYRIYLKCPNNSREKLDKWKQNLKYLLNRQHKIWTRWCIGLSNGCLGVAEKMRPVKTIGWNYRADALDGALLSQLKKPKRHRLNRDRLNLYGNGARCRCIHVSIRIC